MRIALPVNDTYLSTVLDFAVKLLIVDIENGKVAGKQTVDFNEALLPLRANKLRDLKVNTLICGAVSNPLSIMIWHLGINIIQGITGNVDQIVSSYIGGRVFGPQHFLPGFGPGRRGARGIGRRRRFRGGRGW